MELLLLFLNSPSSVAAINATVRLPTWPSGCYTAVLIPDRLFQTFNGNTALHVVGALQNSRSQAAAAKLLLTRGADPGLRNLENELPWQLVPAGPGREEVGEAEANRAAARSDRDLCVSSRYGSSSKGSRFSAEAQTRCQSDSQLS